MTLAEEVLTIVHAWNVGDSRRDDVRKLAARIEALEAENVRLIGCTVFAESVRDECEKNNHLRASTGGQSTGDSPSLPPRLDGTMFCRRPEVTGARS